MQVKEAVELAIRQLPEVFPESQGQKLTLEGVEKTEDSRFWKITLSYVDSDHILTMPREYKTVKLRDSDGEFIGARTGFLIDSL